MSATTMIRSMSFFLSSSSVVIFAFPFAFWCCISTFSSFGISQTKTRTLLKLSGIALKVNSETAHIYYSLKDERIAMTQFTMPAEFRYNCLLAGGCHLLQPVEKDLCLKMISRPETKLRNQTTKPNYGDPLFLSLQHLIRYWKLRAYVAFFPQTKTSCTSLFGCERT